MAKENAIIVQGEVIEILPNVLFRVKSIDLPNEILCYASGKIRKHSIRIIEGDRVVVELSPYDLTRGRVVRRL